MTTEQDFASVRYLVDDVQAAVDFYTTHLGFQLNTDAAPAFADVVRGPLRLLLSGPASSGARATPADATAPGRNRIHLVVESLDERRNDVAGRLDARIQDDHDRCGGSPDRDVQRSRLAQRRARPDDLGAFGCLDADRLDPDCLCIGWTALIWCNHL